MLFPEIPTFLWGAGRLFMEMVWSKPPCFFPECPNSRDQACLPVRKRVDALCGETLAEKRNVASSVGEKRETAVPGSKEKT